MSEGVWGLVVGSQSSTVGLFIACVSLKNKKRKQIIKINSLFNDN